MQMGGQYDLFTVQQSFMLKSKPLFYITILVMSFERCAFCLSDSISVYIELFLGEKEKEGPLPYYYASK